MDAINDATLGARLQGAQHFGLTVQNMDRAFEFYTEVLGGAEIMRDGDFHGGPIHNTILADQEIIVHQLKVDPRTIGVPDLKDGAQRLDVRFVQFDNFVSNSCSIARPISRWAAAIAGPSPGTT
jgi:hypothetical protein